MQSGRSVPLISVVSNVKSSPKFSFNARPRDGRKTDTPGPGSYSAGSSESASRFSKPPSYGCSFQSNVGRLSAPNLGGPGPGEYTPNNSTTRNNPRFGFGTSTRRGFDRPQSPGPGAYKVDHEIGQSSPKYTSLSRDSRRNDMARPNSPGPGAYQPSHQMSSAKNIEPKWGFSRSPREGARSATSPGPGSYATDTVIGEGSRRSGPKYTMRPRHNKLQQQPTPAPGGHGPVYTQFG